jgi:predicted nucleic-acid-binding Zn-ribbon protein
MGDVVTLPEDCPLGDTANVCPKCRSRDKQQGELRAAGGFVSSFSDVSTTRFRYLSCNGCGCTEFYNSSISGSAMFLDFLGGQSCHRTSHCGALDAFQVLGAVIQCSWAGSGP